MITLLYIYFIANIIVGIAVYFISYSDIWDDGITAIRNMSNETLSSEVRNKIRNNVIVAIIMVILMVIFL